MTRAISPGGAATQADLLMARVHRRLLRAELPWIRAAATAWRNGLAGLLAAIAGFSLIRGRSDIRELAPAWGVFVGLVLLATLLSGVAAAFSLIRAASGRPSLTPLEKLPPAMPYEYIEARKALRALRRGIGLSLCCAALLAAAVAITWYGPGRLFSCLSRACTTNRPVDC
jgi:hypothetical protein